MNDKDYYRVQLYIEKTIKKLRKLKDNQRELYVLLKDYMEMHSIPLETPLDVKVFS